MAKRKILVVDDEKGFTDMLRLNLESTGSYEVRVVNQADQALTVALNYRPDLILLDIIMPRMEGPDVAFEIKHTQVLEEIPIIFLTATVMQSEVDSQDGVIGGHAFVAKPSSLSVLLSSIERHMGAAC